MRLTQVVPVESYTVAGLYTDIISWESVSLTVEWKYIFIIQSVLFIISYILLLLFRSIYFLFVITLG